MAKKITYELFGNKAAEIEGLINGYISPRNYKSVQKWLSQCYNEPSHKEMVMTALNEVLEGYGVEAIRGEYWSNYYGDCIAEYINMGDNYPLTIFRNNVEERYEFMCFEDFVLKYQKKYKIR